MVKGESVLKIVYNKPTWKLVDSLLHATSDTCSTGWIRETKREYERRKGQQTVSKIRLKQEAGIKCVKPRRVW